MKKVLSLAIAVIAFMALLSGCLGTGGQGIGELAVLDHELLKDASGNISVRVVVKNVGTATVEMARVEVNFYDAEKNLIDSASDSVMNLVPRDTWEFNIACGRNPGQVRSYTVDTLAGSSGGL